MTQPDIILIVLDTQRADRLGCYGYPSPLTPNLDRFASQSTLFEQAISPAQWTVPSHASLFTGQYPTAHQLLQADQTLSPDRPHLAELMTQAGYETVGFCNNPLVGILNNGLKRGFDTFYNYGGAIPSVPSQATAVPWPFSRAIEAYTQFLRRISYPIQNFFGQSDLAFRLSLASWATPFWSRLANFKGQNKRSVQDLSHWLTERENTPNHKPLFLFLNLMETHLPFWPPAEFIDKVAPYLRENKEARDIMRRWNREAYRWAAPLAQPHSPLEAQVLSDLYDAEVAYQDDYLGHLFATLNGRANHANTLTLIVADHGDGLGEHGYMGHAFVAYQELVHVPLIMQWPQRLPTPSRITTPVSTRRIFHTVLDAAGRLPEAASVDPATVHALTLLENAHGRDPENGVAFTEVYPPMTFVRAIEKRQPALLEQYRCLATRRAVVQETDADGHPSLHKLIHLDDVPDELLDLTADPLETTNVIDSRPSTTGVLHQEEKRLVTAVERQRDTLSSTTEVEIDTNLLQRLRALGYID